MLKLRHIALSAFEIINDSGTILIDPFVSLNAQYNYRNSKNISDIFVTHGHYDHVGQTVEIAKNTETDVTAIVDVAAYFKSQGVEKVHPVGVGSWLNYDWGRCVFLPAIHTCTLPNGASGGVAASILFEIDGVRIFHAGDTSLTVEFKGINEVYHPDVALLPIGGIYGMDIEHAVMVLVLQNLRVNRSRRKASRLVDGLGRHEGLTVDITLVDHAHVDENHCGKRQ